MGGTWGKITNILLSLKKQYLMNKNEFYKDLYTYKIKQCENVCQFFLKPETMPRLNEIDKQLCDAPLKLEELVKAVKELENVKSPVTDGFSVNFYNFFFLI